MTLDQKARRAARRNAVVVFAVITFVLLLAGFFHFRSEVERLREEKYVFLSSVGELKAAQIEQWRNERAGDTRRLARELQASRMIPGFLADPDRLIHRADLIEQLQLEKDESGYAHVFLMAPDGGQLLALDENREVLSESTRLAIAEACAGGGAVLSDIFREPDGMLSIDSVMAIRDGDGRALAAVVLRIHASDFLFPLIQSWPTASRTAETLLVEKDGDDVVFLNELRHSTGTALALRFPLSRTDIPAVQGVLGREGQFEGLDYRGVNALSDLRRIQGSSWVMVAKIDTAEIYGEIRYQMTTIAIIVGVLILLAAAGSALVYRRWVAGQFLALYELERRRRAAEEIYRTTLYSIGDAVIATDTEGKVQQMNHVAEQLTGWAEAEAHGRDVDEIFRLREEATRQPIGSPVKRVLEERVVVALSNHTLLIARDGSERPISDSAAPIKGADGAVIGVVLVFSDESAKHAARRALREGEERLRLALGAAHQGLYDLNVQTGECVVNAEYSTMLGYDPATFRETNEAWRERLHPDDREAVHREYTDYVSGKRDEYRIEFRQRTRDGRWKWILSLGKIVAHSEDGRPLRMLGTHTEITDQKLAEETLRRSEARFRHLLQGVASVAVQGYAADGTTQYWNHASELLYGYSEEEAIGRSILDLVIPTEMQAGVREAIAEMVRTGNPIPASELSLKRKDGTRVTVFTSHAYVRVPGRDPELFSFDVDLTQRQQAEEALRRSEFEFRGLAEAMPQIVWITRADGWNIYFNQRWTDYTGLSLDESHGHGWNRPFHPDDKQRAWEAWKHATETVGTYSLECRLRRADGEYRWWLIRGIPQKDTTGKVIKWFGTCTDIHDLQQAEAENARLALAVENAAESIIISDTHGTILYANPAFEKNSGYSRAETLGENPRLLKSGKHDAQFYRQMWDVLSRGEIWRGHMINRRKDGTFFEEEATISPMRDGSGTVVNYVAVKRDVTREVQLEGQFRQAQKMEAFGQLAGGVAHDFNNILSVIMMQGGMLGAEDGQSGEAARVGREIIMAAQRGANLTRQLLLFSKRQTLQPALLNLVETVSNMTKMLRRIVGEDISIVIKAPEKPLKVKGDSGMLDQVLMNLVVNARDAMPRGGELIIQISSVDIDEFAASQTNFGRPGRFACLEVTDTGNGIPAELLPRIFEPFFTTKDVGKGTGLGLATVFGIVEQHNGWVGVYSEVGNGSTFRVYLPRDLEDGELPAAPEYEPAHRSGNETILVVEDEPALRLLLRTALRRLNYRVVEVGSGVDALDVWKNRGDGIDLVLTDMVMPGGINGKELAQHLCRERPGLKVVYMSGYSVEVAGAELKLEEGVNFLPKPFVLPKLAEILRRSLDSERDPVSPDLEVTPGEV